MKRGGFINIAKIEENLQILWKLGGICNMHHCLWGMDAPGFWYMVCQTINFIRKYYSFCSFIMLSLELFLILEELLNIYIHYTL